MKSGTKIALAGALTLGVASFAAAEGLRERILREAAIRAGLVPAEETRVPVAEDLAAVGKLLFESRALSFAEDTACASCHVDRFGSADGLPVAIGTDGEGFGSARIESGGDIIPRNALPFWGRGGVGFDTFFSDGRVQDLGDRVHSQFGDVPPSSDPLVVAVHLPPVEIGEMVIDQGGTDHLQTESVETANEVYALIAERIQRDAELGPALSDARDIAIEDIAYIDVAEAIAAFIRSNFGLKPTRFHDFVFGEGELDQEELIGAQIFYGRGGCSGCHSGPYFSDLDFHALPFPQFGFGKNGFGIDYGRFNVTLNDEDRYSFRTPPLYNVTKTAPYSHSGSVADLSDAIRVHVDPLGYIRPEEMTLTERVDLYERLRLWADTPLNGVVLSEEDVSNLVSFLGTLSYESAVQVNEVD